MQKATKRHPDFITKLEQKVAEQLKSQRVGYLLGAGSSYLDGFGYPLAFELWNLIKGHITDKVRRDEIQAKLDVGAQGLEQALDLLDDGLAVEGPHRHLVTEAVAGYFQPLNPTLNFHIEFISRLSLKAAHSVKVFSLNYDPMVERAAEIARVRLCDGFVGCEHAYFDQATFEERLVWIRGSHKGKQIQYATMPINLYKLHGSIGWYSCDSRGVRRCAFSASIPNSTKRLMIPPQRRKANDTMTQPYASLWSAFRAHLGLNPNPLNRLVCLGYGFSDEHVNAIIDGALSRSDFTLLIFAKELSNEAWKRWSIKGNVVVVTESRCSIKSEVGPGHSDLWKFERIAKEV